MGSRCRGEVRLARHFHLSNARTRLAVAKGYNNYLAAVSERCKTRITGIRISPSPLLHATRQDPDDMILLVDDNRLDQTNSSDRMRNCFLLRLAMRSSVAFCSPDCAGRQHLDHQRQLLRESVRTIGSGFASDAPLADEKHQLLTNSKRDHDGPGSLSISFMASG